MFRLWACRAPCYCQPIFESWSSEDGRPRAAARYFACGHGCDNINLVRTCGVQRLAANVQRLESMPLTANDPSIPPDARHEDDHTRREDVPWSESTPLGDSTASNASAAQPDASTPGSGTPSTGTEGRDSVSRLPQGLQDRYRLVRVLGKGGFANVYLAYDGVLDQNVAIKVLKLGLTSPAEQDRFLMEARIGAKLRHPHIISVLDIIQSPEGLQMIMEYCPGGNLSEWVKKNGPLRPRQAIEVARQVAQALSYAHRHNFVHRDIKPANIFMGGDGMVKLGDFGIAAYTDLHEYTQTGMIIGTPLYMAPEQSQDSRDVDPRADIYSLGLTLYFMLTGQSPRVLDLELVHPEFRPLIRQSTTADRNERLVSAEQFIAMLDQIHERISGGSTVERQAGAPGAAVVNADGTTTGGTLSPKAPTTSDTPATERQSGKDSGRLGIAPAWLLAIGGTVAAIVLIVVALQAFNSGKDPDDPGAPTAARNGTPASPPAAVGTDATVAAANGIDQEAINRLNDLREDFPWMDGADTLTTLTTGSQLVQAGGERTGDPVDVEDSPIASTTPTATQSVPAEPAASTPTATVEVPSGPASVGETLRALMAAPRANHVARATALYLQSTEEPNRNVAAYLNESALDTLRIGLESNPALAQDPLAFLMTGVVAMRLNLTPVAEQTLEEAYRLNAALDGRYDLDPDRLREELHLTPQEVQLLHKAGERSLQARGTADE